MTQTVNFEGNRGECKEGYFTVTSRASMAPNETASVNGGSPEQSIIANDDAKVFAIALQKIAGIYDYQVRVEAQGPSGAFSGSMYQAFEDESGDIYYLSIYSSKRQWHTVSYNSDKPNIVAIYWSDYSFTVKKDSAREADFQAVSPAHA